MNDVSFKTLREMIEKELETGERIAWTGQPKPVKFASECRIELIWGAQILLFFMVWLTGVVIGTISLSRQENNNIYYFLGLGFILFSMIFLVPAVRMLLCPFRRRKTDNATCYAITNRRAISVEIDKETIVRKFTTEKLTDIKVIEKPDGTGDIRILYRPWMEDKSISVGLYPGFRRVENVRKVEELLKKLRDNHTTPSNDNTGSQA